MYLNQTRCLENYTPLCNSQTRISTKLSKNTFGMAIALVGSASLPGSIAWGGIANITVLACQKFRDIYRYISWNSSEAWLAGSLSPSSLRNRVAQRFKLGDCGSQERNPVNTEAQRQNSRILTCWWRKTMCRSAISPPSTGVGILHREPGAGWRIGIGSADQREVSPAYSGFEHAEDGRACGAEPRPSQTAATADFGFDGSNSGGGSRSFARKRRGRLPAQTFLVSELTARVGRCCAGIRIAGKPAADWGPDSRQPRVPGRARAANESICRAKNLPCSNT